MTTVSSLVLTHIDRRDRKLILTTAAQGLKEKIEDLELKVLRHERFLECPLPSFASDKDTRREQLESALRYLAQLRSAYEAVQKIIGSLDKVEAKEAGQEIADFVGSRYPAQLPVKGTKQ